MIEGHDQVFLAPTPLAARIAAATWREQAIEAREAMHRAKLDRRAALRRERKYGPHLPFFGEPA